MNPQQPSSFRNPESTPPQQRAQQDKLKSGANSRFGISADKRFKYTSLGGFTAGAAIGYVHGSKIAGFRFRAENAHRFPTTKPGWYLYHKDKSYLRFTTGVNEGLKMGFKLGAGAFVFSFFEETVDNARHERDFLSTVTAGLAFSGCCSLLARHDVYTAARTAKFGLKFSLAYGLIQDLLSSLKGNPPAYVDFILGIRKPKME
ncbi:hypothetical protein EYZ11_009804 [Aspergillus tanneri]|uniref:Mitochondrial import inner membrane translocase subunit TIM22 n=1 Tax=Aspergillus tanneri TaxID=1220188 RepID=A0A4S3J944_9EURO|nr:uncharacterized protein ATNIH1004_006002 [Aspergillus tanneri]KAA8647310.1 hypothetical protein ATNIH1004_006002 [Aspergillus tanneri]THC90737.1 hypothetical protein EYZ11_009804 [Aspergillus tanneri]